MKRKTMIMTAALLFALGGAVALNGQDAQAAKKKVKAVVKGNTLTISGKGAMPSNLKIKKSKKSKVKKIVIKKGITSIPINAFTSYRNVTSATVPASVKTIGQSAFKCKKLKKLTVPGNFKIKSYKDADYAEFWITDKVDTVVFNTNLVLDRVSAFDADNLVVKKSDPKYKSIDGVIYSKDGKEIVRVPFQREEITLAEGCEVFCLQSVMYAINEPVLEGPIGGCRVKKIVIPSSVKKVESELYDTDNCINEWRIDYQNSPLAGVKVEIQSGQLDGQSFSELVEVLKLDIDDLMRQVPDQITFKDNMYTTSDHLLLKYVGKGGTVKIPEGITKVGDYAFWDILDSIKITKLELPEGLTEIGKGSFQRCSGYYDGAYYPLEVSFPASLKKIGDYAFANNMIQKLVLPSTIEKYGEGAFEMADIEELVLPDNMKEIPERMVWGNRLKKITIPDSVEKIGKGAFAQNHELVGIEFGKNLKEIGEEAFYCLKSPLRNLTIPASVKKIGKNAFGTDNSIFREKTPCSVTIQGSGKDFSDQAFHQDYVMAYTGSRIEEQRASLFKVSSGLYSKKMTLDMEWTQVKGAAGYELMAATNAKFTKNKVKITVKGNVSKETIVIKGKFKENTKTYVRLRPFTNENGIKRYGRWSKTN